MKHSKSIVIFLVLYLTKYAAKFRYQLSPAIKSAIYIVSICNVEVLGRVEGGLKVSRTTEGPVHFLPMMILTNLKLILISVARNANK